MKKIASLVLAALCSYFSIAQVDSLRQELDYLFGNLDKSQVQSGSFIP